MKRLLSAFVALGALVVSLAPSATGAPVNRSKNVSEIAHFRYTGGTELAHDPRGYLFAGELDGHTYRAQKAGKGGVHIFDIRSRKPKEIGFIHCPGNDNDVAIVKPGLLALGYHSNACNPFGEGLTLFDVTNPRRPRRLGSVTVPSSHTITPVPGKPLVYVSPGGLGNGGGQTSIVDVRNPMKPKVVASFKPNPIGCHDVSFSLVGENDLAFCAGGGEIQIWDVSDPLKPQTLSHIVNPLIQFPHYGLASPDGKILVIDDEAFAAHDCTTGQSPTGAFFVYDISIPQAPLPVGRYAPPRGRTGIGNEVESTPSWCTSHHYNFVPGTRDLVISWFTGGTSVMDLSDPTAIRETAYYQPADAIAYTSHFFAGRVFVNDMNRGLDVVTVKGLKPKK